MEKCVGVKDSVFDSVLVKDSVVDSVLTIWIQGIFWFHSIAN